MTSERERLIREIEREIGDRKLVWFGTVGADARPLLEIEQFDTCISFTVPSRADTIDQEICLETISGRRVNLENYRPSEDDSRASVEFRKKVARSLDSEAVIVPYRPFQYLSDLSITRQDFIKYLGLHIGEQAAFEHKPWVETQLRTIPGVTTIGWHYYGPDDHHKLTEASFLRGPKVVRDTQSTGGNGITIAESREDLENFVEQASGDILSTAPFHRTAAPLNVNACVFPNGHVSLHPASLQYIGLDGTTSRDLGYCGNDFAAVRRLDTEVLDQLDELTRKVGRWLSGQGYCGAFGVDAISVDGDVRLTEINPRFQGSSILSSKLEQGIGRADVHLAHMAAFLGLEPPEARPLKELVHDLSTASQIYLYQNTQSPSRAEWIRKVEKQGQIDQRPDQDVDVEPGGVERRLKLSSDVPSRPILRRSAFDLENKMQVE